MRFTEYLVYDQHGLRLTYAKLDDESGSPFMTPFQGAPHRHEPLAPHAKYPWRLDEIPLDRLILRDTVVLDVP